MTTPQYDLLRASITTADHLRVFDILAGCIGYNARTTIDDIARRVYGSASDNNVRKARDVIEDLRTLYGIPVCSTSGKAGRWLAANEAEKNECLADYEARKTSIEKVITALKNAKVPPPAKLEAVQPGLFGV